MCDAGCSRPAAPRLGNALLAIVINIENFIPIADFEGHVARLIDFVKASPTAPGYDEISIPGERSARTRRDRLANGIPLDDATWESLAETARRVGVEVGEV
ncbi:Ldh family oxidoreductase [Candidatus Poribacteria bacterium]|nr:Ldh family oxidoreductase [Candidatus Poribacteria bacterium]